VAERDATPRFRISAKDLGQLAMPEFCPRCFWLDRHYDLPFGGPFPGIFSSLDSYSKKVVHASFDRHGTPPSWLAPLGSFTSYIPPPAPQKFFIDDDATGIRLTGTPDGILVRADGRKVIVDYKTAKHTEAQDELRPIYEVQLNGYARIAEARGLGPVDRLALVYTEPITDGPPGLFESARTEEGFVMGFRATLEDVPLDPDLLPPLMRRAREIYDAPRPPRRSPGCEDCDRFAQLSLAAQDWP
jgi:hypothetical protein